MFSLKLLLPTFIICALPFLIDLLFFLPQPLLIDSFRHYFMNKQINLGQRQKIFKYFLQVIKTYTFWITLFIYFQVFWIKRWLQNYCKKKKIICKNNSSKKMSQKILTNISYQPVQLDQVMNNKPQMIEHKQKKTLLKLYFGQKTVFITLFLIFLLSVFLTINVQRQSLKLTHEFKFGKNNWMGISQYFSLDFFHNLPQQFKGNQVLKTLFLEQDKALSSLRAYILNYRFIFGIFRLAYGSLGVFFLIFVLVSFFLLNSRKNIQSQIEHIVEHPNQKHHKKKISFRITFGIVLVNILIIFFFFFLFLASIFSQIKLQNSLHICTKPILIQGFTINLIPQTQTQIYQLIQQQPNILQKNVFESQQQVQMTINRHNIIFLYENLCEITDPFFTKIKQLQSQTLYVFRLGYLFLLYTILAIHGKFHQLKVKEQRKSQKLQKSTQLYHE